MVQERSFTVGLHARSSRAACRVLALCHTQVTVMRDSTRVAIKRPCSNWIKHISALLMNTEGRRVKNLFAKINFITL